MEFHIYNRSFQIPRSAYRRERLLDRIVEALGKGEHFMKSPRICLIAATHTFCEGPILIRVNVFLGARSGVEQLIG
jgi:hypothetical protein